MTEKEKVEKLDKWLELQKRWLHEKISLGKIYDVIEKAFYEGIDIGFESGIKAKVNITTISDAPLMKKESMTDKQKNCIDWIEEMTGAVYEGGNVSDFINEHIEEARFQSELNADANDPNG